MEWANQAGGWRSAVFGILVVLALALAGMAFFPATADANTYSEQATVYNCDGTEWAFRFTRMPDGSVGQSYGYAPVGGNRAAINWSAPVGIGGVVASHGDISAVCLVGKVWVFAKFTTPVDGTARLYERHGYSGDLANGYGGGWFDGWYHWR